MNENDIKRLTGIDSIFASIASEYGYPPAWQRAPGFVSLVKIILGQRVSIASAAAHFLRLENYLKMITPSAVARLTENEMRSCQISRQKAKCLRELSMSILSNSIDMETLGNQNETEVREQLTSVNGIGEWTADIYLMFCLQAKDIFPFGDVAVTNTVKELSGAKTKEEIMQTAEKWRPLRSLATYFLWHYYLRKRNRLAEIKILIMG